MSKYGEIIIVIVINFSQKTRVTQKVGPANVLPKRTRTRYKDNT